ncbi:hypothetical protein AB835_11280 [Candidatus Endobugula sertula]|uniref:Uncharacterized protein n=1 Tax=Candidatus Endobugula sertula TaxID=62101 RepID=A0A1D2QN30_9GAMM|nr:hypothetical protein AB835_11280 [Candidatus Endobugula sertula]
MKIIKWLGVIFWGMIGFLVLWFIYCELNKAYWDYQVKKMCKKDGGVTVFERIDISKKEYPKIFSNLGKMKLPNRWSDKNKFPYFYKNNTENIKLGKLSVKKHLYKIINRKTKKIITKSISYSRIGGDFPILVQHPSSFSCEKIKGLKTLSSIDSTFIIKE